METKMKPRNKVCKDLWENGLYRAKTVPTKKVYKRNVKHRLKDYA